MLVTKDFTDWAKSPIIELSFMTVICHKFVYGWVLYYLNVNAIMCVCAYMHMEGAHVHHSVYTEIRTQPWVLALIFILFQARCLMGYCLTSFWRVSFLSLSPCCKNGKITGKFHQVQVLLGTGYQVSILVLQAFSLLSHCLNLFVSILLFKKYVPWIHTYVHTLLFDMLG